MSGLQIGIHRHGEHVMLRDGLCEILLSPRLAREAAREMVRSAERIESNLSRMETRKIIVPRSNGGRPKPPGG